MMVGVCNPRSEGVLWRVGAGLAPQCRLASAEGRHRTTVEVLVLHRAGPRSDPMHYESYALQEMWRSVTSMTNI
jgi:hypothetical protein